MGAACPRCALLELRELEHHQKWGSRGTSQLPAEPQPPGALSGSPRAAGLVEVSERGGDSGSLAGLAGKAEHSGTDARVPVRFCSQQVSPNIAWHLHHLSPVLPLKPQGALS